MTWSLDEAIGKVCNQLDKLGLEDNTLIITLDIIPTAIEMAGGDAGEFETLDGVNILPYLAGFKNERPHQTLYWNGDGPFSAIRDVDWKLIKMPDRLPELYNLSGEYPEILKSLHKKLYA
jgi:arylsulfatase A-like enzyme